MTAWRNPSASEDFVRSNATFAAFCLESENKRTFLPSLIKLDLAG